MRSAILGLLLYLMVACVSEHSGGKAAKEYITYYGNNQIEKRYEGFYVSKDSFVYNGRYRSYYKNGQLREDCYFDSNIINGYGIIYYANGKVKSKGYKFITHSMGPFWFYDSTDGHLYRVVHYLMDSVALHAIDFDAVGKITHVEGSIAYRSLDTPSSFASIKQGQPFKLYFKITPLPKIRTELHITVLRAGRQEAKEVITHFAEDKEYNITDAYWSYTPQQKGRYTLVLEGVLRDSTTNKIIYQDKETESFTIQ